MKIKPKWGSTREIDYRTKVGTPAWTQAHPVRVRKLSTWRFLHTQVGHEKVKQITGGSGVSLKKMLAAAGK